MSYESERRHQGSAGFRILPVWLRGENWGSRLVRDECDDAAAWGLLLVESPMSIDIFASCTRKAADLARVFEYADNVGYFYLYALNRVPDENVVDSILIISGEIDFGADYVSVRWTLHEDRVGLFIRGVL